MADIIGTNRTYRDRLFKFIFGNPPQTTAPKSRGRFYVFNTNKASFMVI